MTESCRVLYWYASISTVLFLLWKHENWTQPRSKIGLPLCWISVSLWWNLISSNTHIHARLYAHTYTHTHARRHTHTYTRIHGHTYCTHTLRTNPNRMQLLLIYPTDLWSHTVDWRVGIGTTQHHIHYLRDAMILSSLIPYGVNWRSLYWHWENDLNFNEIILFLIINVVSLSISLL